MALRWIFGPTVVVDGAIRPLVGTLFDPARPGKILTHSTIYNADYSRALSLVGGGDLSGIDATAGLINLLGGSFSRAEHKGALRKHASELGWSQQRIDRVKSRFAARGITVSDTDKLHRWLTLAGRRMRPGFDARVHGYSRWRD